MSGLASDAGSEWAMLEPVILGAEAIEKPSKAPGRPRAKAVTPSHTRGAVAGVDGIRVIHEADGRGHSIRFEGEGISAELVEAVLQEIQRFLTAK